MFSFKDIKEKLSKEKAIETSDSIYTDKTYKFTIEIREKDIIDFLNFKVYEHNESNPDKEIEASDVVNAVVEKALLENALFNKYFKTYKQIEEESLSIRMAVYESHYYNSKTVPLAKENKELKADIKAVNTTKELLLKENNELKSELASIKKIVNKE